MSSPPTMAIRKCPSCGDLFESSNGDGFIHIESGMTWTDGDLSDDIQLADDLYKCHSCLETFYIDKAEVVGLDNLEDEVKDGVINGYLPVGQQYSYLNIPDLKGFKGSTIKHKHYDAYYLPIKELPSDYSGKSFSGHYNSGVSVDYAEVLEKKLYSTLKQELEIRLRVWWSEKWSFADDVKNACCKPIKEINEEDKKILRGFSLSKPATGNVSRMIEIWDLTHEFNDYFLPYKIMNADMYRQIGRFDECLGIMQQVLKSGQVGGYDDMIEIVVLSCNDQIKCPRKSEFKKRFDW